MIPLEGHDTLLEEHVTDDNEDDAEGDVKGVVNEEVAVKE